MPIDVELKAENGQEATQVAYLLVKYSDIEPGDLQKAGDWLADHRALDTYSGRNVDGGNFAPYSPAYALKKGSSTVNLYSNKSTTHMLHEVKARVEGDELQVGIFNDAQLAQRAKVLNEGGTFPKKFGKAREEHVMATGDYHSRSMAYSSKAKGSPYIQFPAREWLGANQQDLDHMCEIAAESRDKRLEQVGK